MRTLHEDKRTLERELKKAKNDREAAEDRLAELKLQHDGLQELMATLKDGKGAAKVTEWHAKMGELRLQDLKLNRVVTRLQEEVSNTSIQINEISFELQMEKTLMLMIFAVLLCYLSSSERKARKIQA